MTNLLPRLFIRDYKNFENPTVRSAYGKLAGVVGIICNVLLFAAKLAIGLLSGSVSITADAVNNLSDASSSVVTLLGFKLAEKPADEDHPYGHARMEYLSGLAVAALILVIGVELVKSSVTKIIHPEPVAFSPALVVVLVLSMAVKLWMCHFNSSLGRRMDSDTLKATAADSRNDVITTGAVLLAAIVAQVTNLYIDGYAGLLVALFILWSGVGIAKDTMDPLLGLAPSPELVQQISDEIRGYDKVLGLHDLMVHDYGPGRRFASVHVEMDSHEDPLVCHDIIDDIECQALEELHVHLVIHYDPVVEDDAEWNQMRQAVEATAAALSPRLSVHDFRLVRGAKGTKVVFDLAVPYDMAGQRPAIKARLEGAVAALRPDYLTVIRFDGKA